MLSLSGVNRHIVSQHTWSTLATDDANVDDRDDDDADVDADVYVHDDVRDDVDCSNHETCDLSGDNCFPSYRVREKRRCERSHENYCCACNSYKYSDNRDLKYLISNS